MRIGVIGINHKLADLKLREFLAKACQRRFSADCSMHGIHAFILLSTCNRTEIYFSSDDLTLTHTYVLSILRQEVDQDFDQKLYSYFGFDCFQHLCRVTSGLDSAIVAETEIQGQVKASYEKACHYCKLPSDLHYLFQKALRIGKLVRIELPSKPGLPNLEHAVLSSGVELFDDRRDPKILFIGASDINLKVLSFLKQRRYQSITICNRTQQTACQVSEKYGVNTLTWDRLPSWIDFDWIVCGTKASDFLITRNDLEKRDTVSRKLLIDLCVPRNVDPQLGKTFNLLNIDQINKSLKSRRHSLTESLAKAEDLIVRASAQHIRQFKMREIHKLQLVG